MSKASVARKGHRTSGARKAAKNEQAHYEGAYYEGNLGHILSEMEQVAEAFRTLMAEVTASPDIGPGRDRLVHYSKWHLCDQLEKLVDAAMRAHVAAKEATGGRVSIRVGGRGSASRRAALVAHLGHSRREVRRWG